ncbi:hypothetical protein M0812_15672 [Anaeramoeba flamelloides]|uniref:Uncharacterized protein n=1 Tax=Anaeramoeba flamelloides TaxID=1746091 RepID=A0AAV7ZCA1_9EUKA|nr:hypothetical protein M0812_15672 [Anaeramoeba flamelloides]
MTDLLFQATHQSTFDCNSIDFVNKFQKNIKQLTKTNYQEEKRCVVLQMLLPILSERSFKSVTDKTRNTLRSHFLDLWCFLIRGLKTTYHHRKKLYSKIIYSLMKREEFCLPKISRKSKNTTNSFLDTQTQHTKSRVEKINNEQECYSKCKRKVRDFLTFYREAMLETQDWVENEMKDTYFLHQDNESIRIFCANVLAISSFRMIDLRKTIHNSLWGEEENQMLKSNPRLSSILSWINKFGTDNLTGLVKTKPVKRRFKTKKQAKKQTKKQTKKDTQKGTEKKSKLCELLYKLEQPYLFSEKFIEDSKNFCKEYLKASNNSKKKKINFFPFGNKQTNWKHSATTARTNSSQSIVRRLERTDETTFQHLKQPLFLMDFISSLHSLILPMVDDEKELFQVPLFKKCLNAFVISVARMIKFPSAPADDWLYFINRLAKNPICYNLFIRTMLYLTDMHDYASVEHSLDYIQLLLLELKAKNLGFPKELQFDLIEYTLEKLLSSEHQSHNLMGLTFIHNFIYQFPKNLFIKFLYKFLFGKLFAKFFLSPFKLIRQYFSEFIVFQFIHFNPQTQSEKFLNQTHFKIVLNLIQKCEHLAKVEFKQKQSFLKFASYQSNKSLKSIEKKSSNTSFHSTFQFTSSSYNEILKYCNNFQIHHSYRPYVKYAFPQLYHSLRKYSKFYKSAKCDNNFQIPLAHFSVMLFESISSKKKEI